MASVIPKSKLKFWVDNNCNVLLIGKHGVGKTAKVKEVVKKRKLKALYFSCATLDPWVDFIGIPMKAEKDGVTYLELIRPKAFAFDNVEFIFLDELNRAPPKVQNAVLELIQFGSINGKKFKKLKMVWGAINPPPKNSSDTNYHVEELDPAMITRFQVRFHVPFKLDEDFYVEKHGQKIYDAMNPFWEALPEGLKDEFPPRSLDYALDMLKLGGDVEDSLPEGIPKQHFLRALNGSGVKKREVKASGVSVKELFNTLDPAKIKVLIAANASSLDTLTANLSNEEFVKLYHLVGVQNSRVTMAGKRLIKAANAPQVIAVHKAVSTLSLALDGKNLVRKLLRERKEYLDDNSVPTSIPVASSTKKSKASLPSSDDAATF